VQQIGRYQIVEELGRGAMGVVYRALDPTIGRTIAIKSIRLSDVSDNSERQRLRDRLIREAQSAGRLSHRNIVTIYDVLEQDGVAHVFMEFVNGPSLEKMMAGYTLPDKAALLHFIREIASGLDYAHRKGIVHRDIKPGNLMLHFDSSSAERIAKVTDFGVAKFVSQQMTQAGVMMGTPNYMAPEQILGAEVSGKTDQFALAVVTYEILTGCKAFIADYLPTLFLRIVREEPPPVATLNPSLNEAIGNILLKALAKEPKDRFQTCVEFADALAEACAAHPEWVPAARGGAGMANTGGLPTSDSQESGPIIAAMGAMQEEYAAPQTLEMPEPNGMNGSTEPPIEESATRLLEPSGRPPTGPATQATEHTREPSTPPLAGPSTRPPDSERTEELPLKTVWGTPSERNATTLPYNLPPLRRRIDEEDPDSAGLPLWRKVTIAVILGAMVAVGIMVYRGWSAPDAAVNTSTQPPVTAPSSAPAPPGANPAVNGDSKISPQGKDAAQSSPPPKTEAQVNVPAGPAQEPEVSPDTSTPAQGRRSYGGRATVKFESSPPHVHIVVDSDESMSCTSPCALELPGGRHTYTAAAPGYGVAQRIIQVPDDRDQFVYLTQNVGIVDIASEPNGSTVYVDGRLEGQTPTTLRLKAGEHHVRIVRAGRSQEQTITVNNDSLQRFTFRWSDQK
jgi:serine/threonine protein kinase